MTCFDNFLLSEEQKAEEVQCEDGQLQCVTGTNSNSPLLMRGCSDSNPYKYNITLDHCILKKSKDVQQEEICSCYCYHHYCNNFAPKCNSEKMFVMHEPKTLEGKEYDIVVTPALDTDLEEFIEYMKSKFFANGYVKKGRKTITTTSTTTTTLITTNGALSLTSTTDPASLSKVKWTWFFSSSVAMMYSKMYQIN